MIDIYKYIGIPFKHLGRNPEEGLDCYGVLINVYKELGITLYDYEYQEEWGKNQDNNKNFFIENYYKEWKKTDKKTFPNVVLLINNLHKVDHAGVIIDEFKFIHGSKIGVIVSKFSEYNDKIYGYFSYDNSKIHTQ